MIQSRSTQCAALDLKFGTLPIFIYQYQENTVPPPANLGRDNIIVGGGDSLS